MQPEPVAAAPPGKMHRHQPSKVLLTVSVIAAALAVLVGWAGENPDFELQEFVPDLEWFWETGLRQQISGYGLLGICIVSLAFSLRKRWKRMSWGRLGTWRAGHATLGALSLVFLAAHTGFVPGANLNRMLWFTFLGVIFFGGITGVVVALEGHRGKAGPSWRRQLLTWTHLIVFWLWVVLTGFHVLTVYYF